MKSWQKRITKKQLAHVKEYCNGTLKGLMEARVYQRNRDAENKNGPGFETCRECRLIALRLGLE
jgi:hypothetical protein